jgi:hypothetical protein
MPQASMRYFPRSFPLGLYSCTSCLPPDPTTHLSTLPIHPLQAPAASRQLLPHHPPPPLGCQVEGPQSCREEAEAYLEPAAAGLGPAGTEAWLLQGGLQEGTPHTLPHCIEVAAPGPLPGAGAAAGPGLLA